MIANWMALPVLNTKLKSHLFSGDLVWPIEMLQGTLFTKQKQSNRCTMWESNCLTSMTTNGFGDSKSGASSRNGMR